MFVSGLFLLTVLLIFNVEGSENLYGHFLSKSPSGSKFVRSKSIELSALLESGQIDYAFGYKNVALEQEFEFLSLPEEVNLSSKKFEKVYQKEFVALNNQMRIQGQRISYALAIPKAAPNLEGALEFVKILKSKKGQEVLIKSGFKVEFFEEIFATTKGKPKSILRIFHAGSLTRSFFQLEKIFEMKFPEVDVRNEAYGSLTAIRQLTELNRKPSLIAIADPQLFEKMMIPTYIDNYIIFAGNELGILYQNKSRYANEINQKNWMEVLLRKDVQFGRSDPNQDPAGYRTLLLWKLADRYYAKGNGKGRGNS